MYLVLCAAIGTLRLLRRHLCPTCRATLDRHLHDLETRQ